MGFLSLFRKKHNKKKNDAERTERTPLLNNNNNNNNTTVSVTEISSPSSSPTLRHWVVLLLVCLLLFGSYYCFELPAALNIQLREWLEIEYDDWQYEFNLLFTLASLPNVLVPLFGGIAMDRIGTAGIMCIFTFTVVLGQALFAIGVSVKSLPLMFAGRLVFGMGGGSLEVAQAKITTDWFRSHALAFALGLNLTFARLPTAANYNITPWLYLHFGNNPVAPIWFGFLLCIGSALCMALLIYLDRPESRRIAGVAVDESKTGGAENGTIVDIGEGHESGEKVDFKQIWTLSRRFWLLCAIVIAVYGSIQPFFHISQDFLESKWFPHQPQRAGMIQSIPDLLSSIGSPFFGYFVDRFGRRGTILPFSAAMVVISHFLLGFTMLHPAVALVWLGIAYSLFAGVVWPCFPLVIRASELGTAFGIATVALNVTLTVVPVVVGWIRAGCENYVAVETFFAGLAASGVALSIWLWFMDRAAGGDLEKVQMVDVQPEDTVKINTSEIERNERI